MSHAQCNKIKRTIALGLPMAALILGACSTNKTDETAEKAANLYQEAEASLTAGDPGECLQLLDSLDANYRSATDVIRKSMALRPKAIEQQAIQDIDDAAGDIEAAREDIDRLRPLFTEVSLPSAGSYFTATTVYDPQFSNRNGLSARVSDIGEFYIVSSVNPSNRLNHVSVSVEAPDGTRANSGTVAYDGELNFRYNNSELITYSPSLSDSIGMFVAEHRSEPFLKLHFNGENGKTQTMKIGKTTIQAIANAYEYAKAVNEMRDRSIDLERLQAIREKARQQQGL